jgi:hypothetical protein
MFVDRFSEAQSVPKVPFFWEPPPTPIEDEEIDAFVGAQDEWFPEVEPFEDFITLENIQKKLPKPPSLLPSNFTEFAFRMPRADGLGYDNFSFEGRRHMRRPYDTPARRILLFCGRQVEKSTLLGNISICYSCMVPAHKTLYVSPSMTQTKTFSSDRIKEPVETSEVLKSFTTSMLAQNVMEKQFVNRSKITLRYAFLNADRTRGIPAHRLLIDELQDIISDNIPIIEQCTSHAPEHLKGFIYAGTPKSLDNTIEYYRSHLSTQGEWVVPCDRHGGETGLYWNVLGEKNISKKGLSCEKCGELINPMHEKAQWARMVKDAVFESYRIPQIMVPWRSWDEILLDYERYPRDKFYNEVLGISYDSGTRPLTAAQLRECCDPSPVTGTMELSRLDRYRRKAYAYPVYAGIDWGTGTSAYTVMVIGMYDEDLKFRVIHAHRFVGEDIDPDAQIERISELINDFNIALVGCDWGFGFGLNDRLIRRFGRQRIWKYHYMTRTKKKVLWDTKLGYFKLHRTEAMSDIFNAIKRKQIRFPRWEEFKNPYAQDMLNIYAEENEILRMIQYDHSPGKPDDTFHALLYCLFVSMLKQPRPDIIAPNREDPTRGPLLTSTYSGPTYQG